MISLNELRTIENPELYRLKNKPVAVLLEGNFTSLYANRASAAQRKEFSEYYGKFMSESTPTAQIVAGDGDIVLNQYTPKEPFQMGYSRSQERVFANKIFLQNSLEYLTGNASIILLRNKELTVRLLNKQKLEEEKTFWQIMIAGLPLLLVGIGWFAFTGWRKKAFG
jgi:gliding-associated putative ABC transporter substrate-binding component GldG